MIAANMKGIILTTTGRGGTRSSLKNSMVPISAMMQSNARNEYGENRIAASVNTTINTPVKVRVINSLVFTLYRGFSE
jgi:hypothetical protein